jgi:parallel beta-helix repeat protein
MSLKAKALIGVCALALLAAGPGFAGPSDGFWMGGSSDGDQGSGSRGKSQGATVVVDKIAGPYHTIMDGIRAAGYAGKVRVHPGIYIESLEVKRPVEIIGLVNKEGEFPLPVRLQAPPDMPCLNVNVEGSGFVAINQVDLAAGAQNVQRSCVELHSGFLSIKDSTISAPSYVSTVLARGGHLSLETTTVSGGREGVLITTRTNTGTYYIVNNKIVGNITGIKIDGIAQANIVGNGISRNSNDGVVYFQGRGTVIGNDIHDNSRAGLVLQDSPQSPTVKANKIYANAGPGIELVPSNVPVTSVGGRPLPVSKGEICDNLITGNLGAGIDVKVSGLTLTCKNDISGNRDSPKKRR